MPFDADADNWNAIHEKIIGLGERSIRKSYYPELRRRVSELERFRYIIDHAGEFIVLFDVTACRISDVNQTLCRRLGHARSHLLGRSLGEIIPSFACDITPGHAVADADQTTLHTARHQCLKADGTTVPVEATTQVIDTDDGPVGLLIARDLTESLQMEELLHHAQKLEAIGTLAGGIAHDFNNILFPIIGYSEMVIADLADDDPNRDHVERILSAAERARQLVKQILSFSRPDEEHKRPMKVQTVIAEALKLLRPTLPSTIDIRQRIDPECGPVMADPTQIHQVFVNLCTNAYQAMRAGGVLDVSLQETVISAGHASDAISLPPGRYVRLSVADTGHGMDPDTMSRIFEPYYTTKAKGEGTGLGLSVIHGIIASHGGDLRVTSAPGKGARFSAYFPRIDTQDASVEAETATSALPGGSEHILLVDDDEMLIQLQEQMLRQLGYRVTAFSDSTAALDHAERHAADIDLLLTDMTMPRLDGAELATRCLAVRRDLPVVLCTGYSELMSPARAADIGIAALLGKPVKMGELAATLRRVLDHGAAG